MLWEVYRHVRWSSHHGKILLRSVACPVEARFALGTNEVASYERPTEGGKARWMRIWWSAMDGALHPHFFLDIPYACIGFIVFQQVACGNTVRWANYGEQKARRMPSILERDITESYRSCQCSNARLDRLRPAHSNNAPFNHHDDACLSSSHASTLYICVCARDYQGRHTFDI